MKVCPSDEGSIISKRNSCNNESIYIKKNTTELVFPFMPPWYLVSVFRFSTKIDFVVP